MTIKYLTGDATQPCESGKQINIIAHIVNNRGLWGRGFVMSLGNRYPETEEYYRYLSGHKALILGNTNFVKIHTHLWVCNMVAQDGVRSIINRNPLGDYSHLKGCLYQLRTIAFGYDAAIHMPRIGTGFAGGDWRIIRKMINELLSDIPVFVYDLPKETYDDDD